MSRRRVVHSCIPCYTRKQKCNREYPCNHCTRRRCTDECVYHVAPSSTPGSTPALTTTPSTDATRQEAPDESSFRIKSVQSRPSFPRSLSASFGYSECSDSNTLALVKRLCLAGQDNGSRDGVVTLTPSVAAQIHDRLERDPERQAVDFLVQYFIAEVNWIEQLVHVPSFLNRYQSWTSIDSLRLVSGLDFAILVLRMCSYASQFLPSPGYTLDNIRGVSLAGVRSWCDETADALSAASTAVSSLGSVIKIQHFMFLGLRCRMQGATAAFLNALSCAVRAAQRLSTRALGDEGAREMQRRTLCNLYIWDSMLARQLDRPPLIRGGLDSGIWQQVSLQFEEAVAPGFDTPDPFAERLLQTRLADFWRSANPLPDAEYDVLLAEERYEKFCRGYLALLPPQYELIDASTAWDELIPRLPLQRQLLHTAIYDSLVWNFRPLLRQSPPRSSLPSYKRVLLESQETALALAALYALNSAIRVHTMLGSCHTRFAGLTSFILDPAVLLVYLCSEPHFPRDCIAAPSFDADLLRAGVHKLSRAACLEAVHEALKRLRMLADASSLAEIGADALARSLASIPESAAGNGVGIPQHALSLQRRQSNMSLPYRASTVDDFLAAQLHLGAYPSGIDDFAPSSLGDTPTLLDAGSWSDVNASDLSGTGYEDLQQALFEVNGA